MKNSPSKSKVVFITTYPTTQCGIETFTQDLTNAITYVFGEAVKCVNLATSINSYVTNPKIKVHIFVSDKIITKINPI